MTGIHNPVIAMLNGLAHGMGSDVALACDFRIAYLENQGNPPFWGADTRFIQAQTCRQNVHLNLATEFEFVANMKMLLRQMIDCVKAMGITKPPEKWVEWRKFVVDTKEEYYKKTIERTDAMFGRTPLHPDLAGRLMTEFLRDELQDNYIAIIDGFTASSFFTDWQMVRYSAHNLDASETIGIGHSHGYRRCPGH